MDQLIRKDDGTLEIKITLLWPDIQKAVDRQTQLAIAETELSGFRKGKAPRELVEPKLDKSELLSKALGELLPPAYSQIIENHKIKPILYPHVHLDKGQTGEDFYFTAVTCEAPIVSLPPDYPEKIKKLPPAADSNQALVPIIDWLKKEAKISIPEILVEEEVNHRLASLAENLTPLGLTMAKYLETKKLTPEILKSQTAQNARTDLEIEFILGYIQSDRKFTNRSQTLKFLTGVV